MDDLFKSIRKLNQEIDDCNGSFKDLSKIIRLANEVIASVKASDPEADISGFIDVILTTQDEIDLILTTRDEIDLIRTTQDEIDSSKLH